MPDTHIKFRFQAFEVDPRAKELHKNGTRLKIHGQPFEVLLLLLEQPGEVVTREEMRQKLWPADTFIDFEHGVNTAIKKLRQTLSDSAEKPRYIETLPRVGYRFLPKVERLCARADASIAEMNTDIPETPTPGAPAVSIASATTPGRLKTQEGRRMSRGWMATIGITASLAVAAGIFALRFRAKPVLGETNLVLVADFANTTDDPVFDDALRQGLSIQLEQSPFLSIISDEQVQQTLQMMGQKPNAKLTPEIAREICQRTGSAAVLDGSIAQIGAPYLLTVKAVSCSSGETLAGTEAEARDKNHVLDALTQIGSQIRGKLGESLSTVQKFNTPLEQATTPSLEALKAFSWGIRVHDTAGDAAAVPFFKRAIELDPNFVVAYGWLGVVYNDLGEPSIAASYTRRGYELRERTSQAEKYWISVRFEKEVMGNIPAAVQVSELWIRDYPRSELPLVHLMGAVYPVIGEYQKAVEAGREAIRLNPSFPPSYSLLVSNYIPLDRLAEAKATYAQAVQRKLDYPAFDGWLYQIAFLERQSAEMERQVARSKGVPGTEAELLSLEADTAAFYGRLEDAREFSRRASDSSERVLEKEAAATYTALSALREALFGSQGEAMRTASAALALSSGRDVEYGAALAFAYAGNFAHAQRLADDLTERFRENTSVQFNYLPALRAKIALARGKPAEAIAALEAAKPHELGETTDTPYGWTALYPVFVRGEAYLAAHQGSEAAAEFQKILNHPGLVVNEPIGALAHLGLARAYLQRDTAKARAAYQDFQKLWKNADPDIPILKQARREYARLE